MINEDLFIMRWRPASGNVRKMNLPAKTKFTTRSLASEPRGQRGRLTPHFLKHGVERGQGHRISDNWIDGSYSILADIALANNICMALS